MSAFAFFVGGVLPYLTIVLFVVGMGYRFWDWFGTKQPGKMTLYPAPKSAAKGVLAEALLFPSLFKGDRVLWVMSWVFHATLALVAIGHLRVVTGLIDQALIGLGMTEGGVDTMSGVAGGGAGIVLLLTGVLLLVRRLTLQRAREVSGVGDYFALVLLITIIVTGNAMRFSGVHFDLETTRVWAVSLVTFAPIVPVNGAFLAHALVGQLLFIYIPFSKILHFGGIFFTHALVKGS
jgi:nitrate reductase gamma subunit